MNKVNLLISIVFLLTLTTISHANDELIVIEKESKEGKKREDYFYLIGTQSRGKPANFTLWRNQFNVEKNWDGKGSPEVTIDNAVSKAKAFYKGEGDLQLTGLELRLGYSFDSTVWYYLISLAKTSDITNRGVDGDNVYRVVVLTSGEVLPPYTPK